MFLDKILHLLMCQCVAIVTKSDKIIRMVWATR